MPAEISEILHTIRDVEGVYGSFVVTSHGALIERDMPSIFDGEVLERAGTRIVSIYETFESVGNDIRSCMLRFKEHKLYTRKLDKGYLCILSPLVINMPTLRMAVNLVARRISPMVANAAVSARARPITGTPSAPMSAAPSGPVHVGQSRPMRQVSQPEAMQYYSPADPTPAPPQSSPGLAPATRPPPPSVPDLSHQVVVSREPRQSSSSQTVKSVRKLVKQRQTRRRSAERIYRGQKVKD